MGSFSIEGGHQLKGSIHPQGAKNEALQILCAVLLTPETVTIQNIPDIIDVNKLIQLLKNLGVEVKKIKPGSYAFTAKTVNLDYLESQAFKEDGKGLRGSIMIVGPLLARFGKGFIPKPGGDKIGRRRLDTHFQGFIKLGASFRYNREEHFYGVESKQLQGAYMLLDEASVTGTANIVMAAVLAKGTTTIYNAACEPYLQQLCNMLNRMGANIQGIGSNLLVIEGVTSWKHIERHGDYKTGAIQSEQSCEYAGRWCGTIKPGYEQKKLAKLKAQLYLPRVVLVANPAAEEC